MEITAQNHKETTRMAVVYIVVGSLEGFPARGYLLNKLIAVCRGGRARLLKAV